MDPITTYTVKSKADAFVWVFTYHLNGDLKRFEILKGALSKKQALWLFKAGNFPYVELDIKNWQTKAKKHFEITIGLPDLSFNSFWNAYGLKTRKTETAALWKKMTDADRLLALQGIRRYNNYLRRETWRNKVDPNRYLKNKRYLDEY